LFHRFGQLEDAAAFLQWDLATLMPPGGAGARAEQLTALKLSTHELLTDPRVNELLGAAEEEGGLSAWQAANLREMRRRHAHATAVPADLVEALSQTVPACELRWRQARADDDFAS